MEELIKDQYKTYSRISQVGKTLRKHHFTQKGAISSRLEVLEKYYKKFRDVDAKINQIVASQTLDINKEDYFTKDLIFKCELMYSTIKGRLLADQPSSSSVSMNGDKKQSTDEDTRSDEPVTKQPKLDVPKFSGKFTEWPAFRRDYYQLVHSNPTLTNEQKFDYLKSVLPRDVYDDKLKVLSETGDRGDNYIQAFAVLEDVFNDRTVLESLLIRLLEQPRCRGHSRDIQRLLDTTTKCLKGLQTIQIDTNSWDVLLIYVFVQRMDQETRTEWYKTHTCHERPSVDDLYKFLDGRVEVLKKSEESNEVYKFSRSESRCPYCKESHSLWKCEKFETLDIDSRLSFVKDNPVCIRCLTANHAVTSCRKEYRCLICNRDHHYLLHKNHSRFLNGDGEGRIKNVPRPHHETMYTANHQVNTTILCAFSAERRDLPSYK